MMSAPSLTLRTLQNEETGIDISVPRFQEEEAPLGGTSILYEISVCTKLDLFKTRLHRNEDVVQFSIFKAYREVEDLYNKLNKKYPKAGLPSVPRSSAIDKYTSEEKVAALDRFMQAVGKNLELCHSSIFTHFIGINSQRLPSFTVPNANLSEVDSKSEKQKTSEDLSDVFPKVKNTAPKAESQASESSPSVNQNVDLFEEEKLVKKIATICNAKKGESNRGLFDDFEDDSLFSAMVTPKPVSPPKQEKKVTEVKPKRKEPEKKEIEVVDDSEIIIEDRKLGNISLFDEQDLGDHITKDEEALFLVTSNNNEKIKKNTLLFSNDSEDVSSDSLLHENLDDLLNLNPLPSSPAQKKPMPKTAPESEKLFEDKCINVEDSTELQPKRPVPLPRKKSFGKSDTEENIPKIRPEVMPRKVFLTKPEVPTKPVVTTKEVTKPAKPPVSAKPALLTKPKPPPKAPKPTMQTDSKDLDVINANQPATLQNQTSVSSLADDLNKLDILKYIEQEQKTLETEPSLFN